jgi:CRP-like cAMP-binding protein
MSRRNSTFIGRILKEAGIAARGAFRSVHKSNPTPKTTARAEEIRFIYKGNYYRRKIPGQKKEPPKLLKLPPAGQAVMPQPFKTPPPDATTTTAEAMAAAGKARGHSNHGHHHSQSTKQTWSWRSWWKLNGPLLVLNFGSLATLVGFTRTDVLELRALSVTGSMTFVFYTMTQPPPIRWPSVFWSLLFSTVNTYKIANILHEKKGAVILTPRQEEIYQEHFQPHGVTPKQFERIMSKGILRVIKSGGFISRQGNEMNTIKLVVKGTTRASVTGRHLTAIGSKPGNRSRFAGGDSGAWIGEMAFLQSLWVKDHASKGRPTPVAEQDDKKDIISSKKNDETVKTICDSLNEGKPNAMAMTTIVAVDDVEVIEWTFDDMNELMKTSGYMQGALTRAMTAAIVGKVANFMMSKQAGIPTGELVVICLVSIKPI